jgi:hypothetical protein
MIALADIIASELATPRGRSLQERLLQAMFMMERFRGVDAGCGDTIADVAAADISGAAVGRLAEALRIFIRSNKDHPDVGSAIWALGALRADEDADLFSAVLDEKSAYDSFARDQAACALEVIRS